MENKKSNKGLVICLLILMLVFAAVSILLGMGIVKSPFVKCDDCKDKTTVVTDDTKNDSNETNKVTKVSEADLSKKTELAVDNCFTYSTKIVNGNIEITNNDKTFLIKTGNAKYIEREAFMACGTRDHLFYITDDGQVYSISPLRIIFQSEKTEFEMSELQSDGFEMLKKLTNSNDNAVAFISNNKLYEESTIDNYNYTNKNIAVVDDKGEIIVLTWLRVFLP